MLFAEHCRLAALGVEGWLLRAGVMAATPGFNVHHAVHSMLLAVYCRIAALDIVDRVF